MARIRSVPAMSWRAASHLAVDDLGVYYGVHDTSIAGSIVMIENQ